MEGRSAENGRVEEGEGKGRGGKGGREGGRERGREGGRGDLPYQSYFVSGAGEHIEQTSLSAGIRSNSFWWDF